MITNKPIPLEARDIWRYARLPVCFIVLIMAGLLVYWVLLHNSHKQMRQEAQANAQHLAHQTAHALALTHHATFSKLDYFTQQLGTAWVNDSIQSFDRSVGISMASLPAAQLVQVSVADAAGNILYSRRANQPADALVTPLVSIFDREHFQTHLMADESFLFISEPVLGRISQQWTIQLARGIWNDGNFMGVIVLSVSADYLAATLKKIYPDEIDAASLVNDSGVYLARSFHLDKVLGKALRDARPFAEHPDVAEGASQVVAGVDGIKRLYSWHRVEGYPLVILVGLGAEKALALTNTAIRDNHWQSAVGTILLLLSSMLVAWQWALGRLQAKLHETDHSNSNAIWTLDDVTRRHEALAALATETSRLTTLLHRFPGGVLIEDARSNVAFVNSLWPSLLGLECSAEQLQGLSDAELRAKVGPQVSEWLQLPEPDKRREGRRFHEVTTDEDRNLKIELLKIENGEYLGSLWLVSDITHHKKREMELAYQAATDLLTGLPNRRSFMQTMQLLYDQARLSEQYSAVVLMLDIDRFKRVNDTYGHAVGDLVLQDLARVMRATIRPSDTPGRIGGEEFAVVLPHTDMDAGVEAAERIRKKVEDTVVEADGHFIRFTISIGIAPLSAEYPPEKALKHADDALYQAKQTGRNKVCRWDAP